MIKLNIIPLEKVNDVKFGAKRDEVREKFKEYGSPTEFTKSKQFSKNTTDDYGVFHIFYNEKNEFEAIEIFENTEVYVDGKLIFPGNVDEILKMFPDSEKDHEYYTSVAKSVGITTEEETGKVEAILFGCCGYYE